MRTLPAGGCIATGTLRFFSSEQIFNRDEASLVSNEE